MRGTIRFRLPLGLVVGAGLLLWGSGTARAQDQPWRSLHASADRMSVLAFTMLPPGDEGGGEGDSVGLKASENETKIPSNAAPPPDIKNPAFERPDTSRTHFNEAPLETLGPSTINRVSSTRTAAATAPHARRGIFGVHPLAILVGLIALHVFVVTSVVK